MIKLTLHRGERKPECIGTIHHADHGVAASIHWNYVNTYAVRRYLCGLEQPNYPVPCTMFDALLSTIHQDGARRWSVAWFKAKLSSPFF